MAKTELINNNGEEDPKAGVSNEEVEVNPPPEEPINNEEDGKEEEGKNE